MEELNTVNDVVSAQARQTQTSFADVLEQQRATDVERARLQAILQSIGDVVTVLDATGVIVLKNQA